MAMKHKRFWASFRVKVALAAVRGDKMTAFTPCRSPMIGVHPHLRMSATCRGYRGYNSWHILALLILQL